METLFTFVKFEFSTLLQVHKTENVLIIKIQFLEMAVLSTLYTC